MTVAHHHFDEDSFRRGLRAGWGYTGPGFLVSLSFGVVATDAGMTPWQAVLMSAIVFAGSAQFASIAVIAAGGGLPAAFSAATLMNSRFLAMGIALAPSLPGGPVRRALQGQAVIDASWALANRGDGTFDRWALFGSTAPQYVGWVAGTALGTVSGDLLGDIERWGLDAVFPAFFVALLVTEVRSSTGATAAVLGGLIALALVPVAPAGVPVLAATAAAVVGLRGRRTA
ncbi:AzlC family ABC transporter permease [Nocardioides caldifontis]|uniref:AzlC family ABC transporter permease n=1 Tax=Nocardioides caldifontis TaxID=2588938 RepID=UPI0011DFE351|nr:AzlC family ABC transporter permease [Nocardioides caldifontis]